MADRLASQMTADAASKAISEVPETQADVALVDYQDLVARCMGNLAFAEKILVKFEQRTDEELALLENKINQQDAAGMACVAHRLKGTSANVSANGLCDIFDRLEQLGRTEQFGQVPECMDALRSEWARFKAQSPSFFPADGGDQPTIAVER